jgi:hypothetical protein
MSLQELVAFAEIMSGLAAALALIISIRQNTKSQKALVVDSPSACENFDQIRRHSS